MIELKNLTCEVCRIGAPQVTDEEIEQFQPQVPDWEIIETDSVKKLTRTFKFKNFVEALAFTNKVGDMAEEAGHHPAILTEWGRVKVTWWTHKIKGLHQNDFVMAARTDGLYQI